MNPFNQAWALLKVENEFEDEWDPATSSEEAFKATAYSGWNEDDDWADHFPEDFDFEGLEAENYDEEIHREYPTGQQGAASPGMKDLRRSQYSRWESPEENEKRFNDLMDNPTREPILVVRDKHGREHILSGYHRMAANIEAGRPHLPALVLNMRDGE